ncbi:MAG: ComEC/Rec2 family competence protein [Anaerolineae bacterium]|nr:ComEC/Rec2 family competence protein [Anaerolineae bacterium]MDW8172442.1 ComEC/Rec2 family competence protein [Anaerolineae bacterium]
MRLVWLALGWAAGIVLARTAHLHASFTAYAALVALGALLIAWESRWRWGYIALLAACLGAWRVASLPNHAPISAYHQQGGIALTGRVASPPDLRDAGQQFILDVESLFDGQERAIRGRVLVQVARTEDVRLGQRVRVGGLLYPPGQSDRFSYADYLARQGVSSVLPDAWLEIVDAEAPTTLTGFLADLRQDAQAIITRALPDPLAALLVGILLGNEQLIDPALDNAFARVGAAHIVAISGFNMMLVAGVAQRLLNQITGRARLSALVAIAFVLLYTLLVGGSAAVWRAALMASLLIVAPLLGRKTFLPASIALIVLLLSLENPLVLWDLGFQLSLAAILGIVVLAEPLSIGLRNLLRRIMPPRRANQVVAWLNEPIAVSLAAQALTAPLIALSFERLSLVSLPVNLLVLPVQPYILMLGGLAVLIAPLAAPLAQVMLWCVGLLLSWTIQVVRAFAALPWADVVWSPSSWLVAALFALFGGWIIMNATEPKAWRRWLSFVQRRALVVGVSSSAALVSALLLAVALARPDGLLHVWFLDVGHSNAVLIQSPQGAHILVDGGRYPSRLLTAIGDRLPFNKTHLDMLILTQPDEQDQAALPALLARYRVGLALTHRQFNISARQQAIVDGLGETSLIPVWVGYRAELSDGLSLEILHPQAQPIGEDLGDESLIVRLRYGEARILLLGDASIKAQEAVLQAQVAPSAQVVQLARHAGRDSLHKTFWALTGAQLAVVQIDPANRLGDPQPATLALIGETPLLRTDQRTTIHLWTDGQTLWHDAP